jgi:hypothetical protein
VLRLDPGPAAEEERTLVRKAVAVYQKKGNVVSAGRARSLLTATARPRRH